jgi:hypothetical protein
MLSARVGGYTSGQPTPETATSIVSIREGRLTQRAMPVDEILLAVIEAEDHTDLAAIASDIF